MATREINWFPVESKTKAQILAFLYPPYQECTPVWQDPEILNCRLSLFYVEYSRRFLRFGQESEEFKKESCYFLPG
jgi:hypothetical protein